jgi:hypothetical protein
MRIFPVIVLFAIFGRTFEQTKKIDTEYSTGTVVYVEHWRDEIIVAADSRVIDDQHVQKDNRCKINVLKGDGIFAAAGFTFQDAETSDGKHHPWNARKTAQEAWKQVASTKENANRAAAAARFFGQQCQAFFQTGLSGEGAQQLLHEIASDNNYGLILDAVFVSKDGDALNASITDVTVNTSGVTPTAEVKFKDTIVGEVDILGYSLVAARYMRSRLAWYDTLPKGLSEDEKAERWAMQIVQWTIDSKETEYVGGDVNAAVMNHDGVKWIQQKEYCKNPASVAPR